MLKGFRDFILRGNVIDLAVAVVIGAAFTALVNAFVAGLIDPVIRAILGGSEDKPGGTFSLNGQVVDIGLIINASITFLLTAAVVYFIFVAPMNRFKAMRARQLGEQEEAVPDDIALLKEIRDLLAQRGGTPDQPSS
jgi:large conductance mechanosensitive channel